MANDYTMVEGTAPDQDEQHEARVLTRRDGERNIHSMMTEIGDGTFVAWTMCARCSHQVGSCTCPSGPVEPEYIRRWRVERFAKSFGDRGAEPALPVSIAERDRAKRAVMRGLLAEGYQIIAPPMPEQRHADDAPPEAPADGKIEATDDEATEEAADE